MGDSALLAGSALVIVLVVLGIFLLLPVLAAFIILLVQCIKHKWTRKLVIPFIIVSVLLGSTILSAVATLIRSLIG